MHLKLSNFWYFFPLGSGFFLVIQIGDWLPSLYVMHILNRRYEAVASVNILCSEVPKWMASLGILHSRLVPLCIFIVASSEF